MAVIHIHDPVDHVGARVSSDNRLETEARILGDGLVSTFEGKSFNANTGEIALTSTTESGVFYLENAEDESFVVESLIVGVDNTTGAPTIAGQQILRAYAAPAQGGFSTAVDMLYGRNFGLTSPLSASSKVLKGAEGLAISGGTLVAIFYLNAGRNVFPINFVLPRGAKLALSADLQVTGGTANIYAGAVMYLRDIIR